MTKSSSYRRGMLDAMNAFGLFSPPLTKTAASRIKMLARAGKYLNGMIRSEKRQFLAQSFFESPDFDVV